MTLSRKRYNERAKSRPSAPSNTNLKVIEKRAARAIGIFGDPSRCWHFPTSRQGVQHFHV